MIFFSSFGYLSVGSVYGDTNPPVLLDPEGLGEKRSDVSFNYLHNICVLLYRDDFKLVKSLFDFQTSYTYLPVYSQKYKMIHGHSSSPLMTTTLEH